MRVGVVVLCALVLAATAGAAGGPGEMEPGFGYGKDVRYARALTICQTYKSDARLRACLTEKLFSLVKGRNSATELPKLDTYVAKTGGFLQRNCHVLMHGVGREYAASVHLTVDRLLDYLPRTNDANCSAGFGHGLLMQLAPQVGSMSPDEARKACDNAATRYQRYSCVHGFGHAYMRLYAEQLPFALHACGLLGERNAADCAAGAFHDYWIAVAGLDNAKRPAKATTSPRALCAKEAGGFVRGCWYRALLEHPPKRAIETPRDVETLCKGLANVQRSGCVIASVVVSAADPFTQMHLCIEMRTLDARDCVRGVRVPELGKSTRGDQVKLIRMCANVFHPAQNACYRWLGTALNVITNGDFGGDGCGELTFDATRKACGDGAGAYEGPLETFS
jgi:hypothetical protein